MFLCGDVRLVVTAAELLLRLVYVLGCGDGRMQVSVNEF